VRIYNIGNYEISDWIYYDSDWLIYYSNIVWYRNVKEGSTFNKCAIRIYHDAIGIHIYINVLSLFKIYRLIFNYNDNDIDTIFNTTIFNSIGDAKNHVDLFFDKFQKLKMFL